MRSHSIAASGVLLALCPLASAQLTQRAPVPARDAGTYHVATGTWSRSGAADPTLGAIIFANDAVSPYFTNLSSGSEFVDEGRLPSTSSTAPSGLADCYTIDTIDISYCVSDVSPTLTLRFYESYAPCTQIIGQTPLAELIFDGSLPGSSAAGVTSCWTLTLDLSDSDSAFSMLADGDGQVGGATDTFGYSFQFDNAGTSGPFLAGIPGGGGQGDGTVFQNPGTPGTGLSNEDFFWLRDPSGSLADGCYFFGGNPYAGAFIRLGTDGGSCDAAGVPFCSATETSLGAPAKITAAITSPSELELYAAPVPNNFGVFCFSAVQNNGGNGTPLFDGLLCVGGNGAEIIRIVPAVIGENNAASITIDPNAPPGGAVFAAGSTWHFQYWFRDPLGGGSGANLTSGWSQTF